MTRALARILVLLLFGACSRQIAVDLGLAQPVADSPMLVDLVCDNGSGSTCTPATLRMTCERVVASAVRRPGSTVRLWLIGDDIGTTAMIGSYDVPPLPPSRRGADRARAAAVADGTRRLVAALTTHVTDDRPRQRSPIAEAITKVAWAGDAVRHRSIVVISDAREYSAFADFECGVIPSPKDFTQALHNSRVLVPGSLRGIDVAVTYAKLDPVDQNRCAVTVERAEAVRAAWVQVLTAAEARSASYTTEPIAAPQP